jgi:hypothetical protein
MAFVPGSFTARGALTFTVSQNWTVPAGVHKIKIIAIAGGGGGGGGYSSTYTGGGGASGAIQYAEAIVNPGDELTIVVGAGGSPGAGGSNPTSGGSGGNTFVNGPGGALVNAYGGGGGGAASSSANGANGAGSGIGEINVNVLSTLGMPGQGGQGTNWAVTTVLPLKCVANASGIITTQYYQGNNSGAGGPGGAVNSNGTAGQDGIVYIWWGDD